MLKFFEDFLLKRVRGDKSVETMKLFDSSDLRSRWADKIQNFADKEIDISVISMGMLWLSYFKMCKPPLNYFSLFMLCDRNFNVLVLTFLGVWFSKLPNGVTYHTGTYQDRLGKLQEHLRQLSILFRKLRLVYDKCNENCAGLDPVPVEVSIFIHI